ncbi:MAG: 2Fe-2S iron-sulfur cluster-binding protein [Myxococcota bacterium]
MRWAVRFLRRHAGVRETLTRDVAEGTTLLDAARGAGLPIARACGERALCGRCDLEILDGNGGLSPETPVERETLTRNAPRGARRLACQARVQGPVCATAGYW